MKLIKPYFEIIEQQSGKVGMLKHIETCGRVAWKSEDKITENSYIKFNEMLKGVNHGSVLEHGTIYLYFKFYSKIVEKYEKNKYSKVVINPRSKISEDCYITTNYRVLIENNWLDDLKYQCEPMEFHEKRVTVKFVCTIGISREFNRHRVHSITEQSTRYCNYSKEKFDSEITFIEPCWINDLSDNSDERNEISGYSDMFTKNDYIDFLETCEASYTAAIIAGLKPQQAREVLPLSTATELVHTAFISDWKHFFELRTASGAHPQAQELAIPLKEKFKELNLI